MKMKTLTQVCFLMVLAVLTPLQLMAAEGGYIVIVNANNPVNSISKAEIQNYYLKKELVWSGNNSKVFPIDLPTSNVLKRRFSKEVLGKRTEQLGAYWNKAMGTGLKKPKVLKTDKAMIQKVGVFDGAIGYVTEGTDLGAKVKQVTVK